MLSDTDVLPAAKRNELEAVTRILFEEFDAALAGRSAPHRKGGRILKVILFGSYARGDWVADPIGGYFSDFDLLLVVNHEELTDVTEYWALADEHLLREQAIGGAIRTPVNFIVHDLDDINSQLRRGRPFFVDIVRDGIALYETPGHPFDKSRPLSPEAALAEARANFEEWFTSAGRYLTNGIEDMSRGWSKEAAFLLHQAAERLYHCTSLVLTLYSPKSHKLNFLRSQAERLAPGLRAAWPRDTRFAQRCFELLRRAYVDARYSPNYRISDDELAWLGERLVVLQKLVRETCEERLR